MATTALCSSSFNVTPLLQDILAWYIYPDVYFFLFIDCVEFPGSNSDKNEILSKGFLNMTPSLRVVTGRRLPREWWDLYPGIKMMHIILRAVRLPRHKHLKSWLSEVLRKYLLHKCALSNFQDSTYHCSCLLQEEIIENSLEKRQW